MSRRRRALAFLLAALLAAAAAAAIADGYGARAVRGYGPLRPVVVLERGIASGVRRIEALTGRAALLYMRNQEHLLRNLAAKLKAAPAELPEITLKGLGASSCSSDAIAFNTPTW